jgi:hypothetical protein
MRSILIATVVAAGIGLAGTAGATAAPINAIVIKDIAALSDSATQVGWHNRWRSHWRWGSRGGGRCHVRWRSWWRWC